MLNKSLSIDSWVKAASTVKIGVAFGLKPFVLSYRLTKILQWSNPGLEEPNQSLW